MRNAECYKRRSGYEYGYVDGSNSLFQKLSERSDRRMNEDDIRPFNTYLG